HRDGVAAVLELAGDVEKVAMARPLAECCPRVFLLFGASLLSGGAEDGLEVVERVIRRHAQRLREPVGRTVTPGGSAGPRLGEFSPAGRPRSRSRAWPSPRRARRRSRGPRSR